MLQLRGRHAPEPSAGAGCSLTHNKPCFTAHWTAESWDVEGGQAVHSAECPLGTPDWQAQPSQTCSYTQAVQGNVHGWTRAFQ